MALTHDPNVLPAADAVCLRVCIVRWMFWMSAIAFSLAPVGI